MPSPRSASRIVEPSGTRTGAAVDLELDQARGRRERDDRSRGTSRRRLEAVDRRLDRVRGRLPEAADRRVPHHLADLVDQRELVGERAVRAPADHPGERLLLPDGPDAARDALPARLVAEERGDPQHDVGEVDVLVEHHHDARPERDRPPPSVLEREPQVELVGRDERPRRAAEQDRLQRLAAPHAAGQLEQLAERDAVLDLVQPGRSTHPERQNSRVPVESGVPIRAYAAPPIVSTSSTFTSVSTLLIPVGLPNSPRSTGNGGLLRGSPRLPSIELNSEVSSPQM